MMPNIAGRLIERLELSVPQRGPWIASVLFVDEASDLPQTLVIDVAGVQLWAGHVVTDGVHVARRSMVITAGPANWATIIRPKPYHVDAGVRARLIVEDLCRELGQDIGSFVPSAERVGLHYARTATRASTILESVIGTAAWWIDYAGKLQVGQRATAALTSYTLESYDPERNSCTLKLDDLTSLQVGSTLALDTKRTVQSFHAVVDSDGIRAMCSLADTSSLQQIVRALIDQRIEALAPQLRRYRVLQMSGDKVDLQIASKATGYPDLVSVTQWVGVAGAWCDLAPDSEVLVSFVDGDRAQPVIVSYVDRTGGASVPRSIAFGGSTKFAARVDDSIAVGPSEGQTITLVGAGTGAGTYTFHFGPPTSGPPPAGDPTRLVGTITSASSLVKL